MYVAAQDTNSRSFKDDHTSSRWNNFVKKCFKLRAGVAIGQSFKDDHTSSRWNNFVKKCFKLRAGVAIGPTTLRSSFVTDLLPHAPVPLLLELVNIIYVTVSQS